MVLQIYEIEAACDVGVGLQEVSLVRRVCSSYGSAIVGGGGAAAGAAVVASQLSAMREIVAGDDIHGLECSYNGDFWFSFLHHVSGVVVGSSHGCAVVSRGTAISWKHWIS